MKCYSALSLPKLRNVVPTWQLFANASGAPLCGLLLMPVRTALGGFKPASQLRNEPPLTHRATRSRILGRLRRPLVR